MNGTVLVTGANGFVGSALLASYPASQRRVGLLRVGREGKASANLSFRSIERWNEHALCEVLTGVDTVIHAASVVHRPGASETEYAQFNVDGTRALVGACLRSRVQRLVFLSTIKVHGEEPRAAVIDESTPVIGDSSYGRTKIEAERIVLDAADSGAMMTAVLRLCPVFGRGDKSNVQSMIRAIARRRFVLPGGGRNRKSIVHISTVCDAAKAAAASSNPGVFMVADREAPTMRELADTISSALGVRPVVSVPESVVRLGLQGLERAFRIVGRTPPFSREQLRKLNERTVCSPTKTERDLGVSCHVDLRKAIDDEVAWLRETSVL